MAANTSTAVVRNICERCGKPFTTIGVPHFYDEACKVQVKREREALKYAKNRDKILARRRAIRAASAFTDPAEPAPTALEAADEPVFVYFG